MALDDFGSSSSNLDRIINSKPDIIKIDRELINGVSSDYYKQAIVEMIKKIAQKIGSLTLAEGVEHLEDIIFCYQIGVDLFQGYYFSKPAPITSNFDESCKDKISSTIAEIKRYLKHEVSTKKDFLQNYEHITNEIISSISNLKIGDCFVYFAEAIDKYKVIECIYLLDQNGKQVGDTICNSIGVFRKNYLFHPASNGTDHSLKDYYFYLNSLKINKYIAEPYISLATGSICRTIATRLKLDGIEYILCVDFSEDSQSYEGNSNFFV